MTTPIPNGLGPFQTLFYKVAESLTAPVEDIKANISEDPEIKAFKQRIEQEKAELNAAVNDLTGQYTMPDSSCVGEYDAVQYNALLPGINVESLGTEISVFENIPNCDEAYWTMLLKIEQLKKDLAAKFSDLDKKFLKIKALLPIMDVLLMLCPPTPPNILPNPVKFLTWIITALKAICNAIITPYVMFIDEFYEFYRKACNDMAVIIVKYLGPVKIKCIEECPFKGRELECTIVAKNKWTQCNVKPTFNLLTSVSSTIVGLIDLTLMPVNTLFKTFSMIIKPFKIVGVTPREYPPQTMSVLVDMLKAKASEKSNVKRTTLPPIHRQTA